MSLERPRYMLAMGRRRYSSAACRRTSGQPLYHQRQPTVGRVLEVEYAVELRGAGRERPVVDVAQVVVDHFGNVNLPRTAIDPQDEDVAGNRITAESIVKIDDVLVRSLQRRETRAGWQAGTGTRRIENQDHLARQIVTGIHGEDQMTAVPHHEHGIRATVVSLELGQQVRGEAHDVGIGLAAHEVASS